MSSDIEIRRAYLDDKKHPYYSVQQGKAFRAAEHVRQSRHELQATKVFDSNVHWTWGHFQNALKRALAG
jgi:hypothetical protein